MIKQVIVWRKDLKVRKGKFGVQIAHASMKIFFDMMTPEYGLYTIKNGNSYKYQLSLPESSSGEAIKEWMNGSFTKIVVGCESEQELFELQKQADEANIVNAIILDNGNTEFKEECQICSGTGHIINTDKGYPDYDSSLCNICNGTGKVNKPTYTCLAIGPDEAEKIDKITGELKLL